MDGSRSIRKRWTALGLLAATAVLVPVLTATDVAVRPDNGEPAPKTAYRPTHASLFFDPVTFYRGVEAAESTPRMEGSVYGGVIPHHWLPAHLITGFFRGLAENDPPDTVVLLGPNHTNAGSARVLTSNLAWETPFGLAEPDREFVGRLVEQGLARVEPARLTAEHSVAGIMPAVKYYLPEAQVVPVILSGDVTPTEALRLGEALAGLWTDDTVIVAAVDFSHYLVRAQAARHDAATLTLLEELDADALFALDNAYLDSPSSIAVLIAAMERLGAHRFILIENTNSGALQGDELAPTTSYVMGYYAPGESARLPTTSVPP